MPRVTIATGVVTPEGTEEKLSEFLCDVPGCANIATGVAGFIKELGLVAVWCAEHAAARNRPTEAHDGPG